MEGWDANNIEPKTAGICRSEWCTF